MFCETNNKYHRWNLDVFPGFCEVCGTGYLDNNVFFNGNTWQDKPKQVK